MRRPNSSTVLLATWLLRCGGSDGNLTGSFFDPDPDSDFDTAMTNDAPLK